MRILITTFFAIAALFIATSGCAIGQPPKLIIRGDDMGFSHSANEAIIECFKEGIMTTVEVMPVTPWFPEVVKLCNENPSLDVGIHLAMTSEWTNIKWRPLSNSPSLTNEDGYFHPMIWPNSRYAKGQSLKENTWKIEEIEAEVRAQIELTLRKIPHTSHISAHMGWVDMDPKVKALVNDLAVEYGIRIDLSDHNVESIGFQNPHETYQEKIESFTKLLQGLQFGKTYMFLEHPG